MKILVTGATGFIGFDLTRKLAGKKHDILCSVRKTSNVSKLRELGVSLAESDITDESSFQDLVASFRPDAVYHCAARVWDADWERLFTDNVKGTSVVCRACHEHGTEKFIYLSSVSVVSGNDAVPLTDDLEYKSSDAYGRSKAEAEKIVISYREKGLKASILRPCMVYGEDEPHALDGIMKSIMSRKIPVLDVPQMDARLALVYVGNVTDVLLLALDRDEAFEGTFMVADKEIISARKFVEIIADELGAKRPFRIPGWMVGAAKLLPPVRGKMSRLFKDRVYDISRMTDILGYVPRVSTEEGLRRTARHWKDSRNEYVCDNTGSPLKSLPGQGT